MVDQDTLDGLLAHLPKNWSRWGPDDEVGSVNFLGEKEVLRGLGFVRKGRVISLALTIGSPKGDPMTPGRGGNQRFVLRDKSHYLANKAEAAPGGREYADDGIIMLTHGTTHFDALGHVWYGDKLWNGYDAKTTIGDLGKGSILPIARHGIVGGAVLLDMARYFKKEFLDSDTRIEFDDLLGCAEEEHVQVEKHDIILVRTGWPEMFYKEGSRSMIKDGQFTTPGLAFSDELVKWFHDMEIPMLGTDTLANEVITEGRLKVRSPLHASLIRNLGVVFAELLWLEALGDDCAKDSQYRFLFVGSPLALHGASGGPVNPLAIK